MSAHNILSQKLDDDKWNGATGRLRFRGPELSRVVEGLYAVCRILRANNIEIEAASGSENSEPLDSFLTAGLHSAAEALAWNAHLSLAEILDAVSGEDESGVAK